MPTNPPANADAEAEADATPASFEASLEELETVVEQMEQGDLPLEQSLSLFERGMQLSEQCEKALTAAEQKVQILSGTGPDAALESFDDEN